MDFCVLGEGEGLAEVNVLEKNLWETDVSGVPAAFLRVLGGGFKVWQYKLYQYKGLLFLFLKFYWVLTGVTLVSSAPGVLVVLTQKFFHSFSLFVLLL